jgi:NhaP-type Na+/H+ or K+/H+ antiporter/Trk K+ transport system NAD-binding subunit
VAATELFAATAELLGARFAIPNFLFFSLAGVAIGPPGLGLVHHEVFGEGLAVVVGMGVAIIIFHSGSSLSVEALRDAPRMAYLLATVGTTVTFLGTAAVAFVAMDVPPGIALLVGALLIPTGTTVIEPLLESVPLPERLEYTLEIEALTTEVTAGILAVAVFYAVTLTRTEPEEFAVTFGWHLLAGVVVGAGIAAVVCFLFTIPKHAPERAPEHASQLYLATAVVAFALAENVAREAGVAAVATAGLLLGNADLPYREHITAFEEDFMSFVLAFTFVALAAFVEPDWLWSVGANGLLVAVGIVFLVRPVAVFLSTLGSVLPWQERAFLGAVSPRGIIPAGLAVLFAIQIQGSNPDAAANITGTVLMVIFFTALVEGVLAPRLASALDLYTDPVVVVGGGRIGLALAERYERQDHHVRVVELDADVAEAARSAGFEAYLGDGTDREVLQNVGAERARRVVAATDDDETNAEVIDLATTAFDVDTVLLRLDRSSNRSLFDGFDVELLTGSQLDLWALDTRTTRPMPAWLAALRQSGGVRTVSLARDDVRTVAELDGLLGDRTFVVALARGEEAWVPEPDERVERGDAVTVLGQSAAVDESVETLAPDGVEHAPDANASFEDARS